MSDLALQLSSLSLSPSTTMASPSTVAAFQDVPTELAEHVLTFCHVRDVARVAQTCKQFRALVYDTADQYLWRALFLLYPFDDLRQSVPFGPSPDSRLKGELGGGGDEVDWRGELQRRVFAETILSLEVGRAESEELQQTLATLVSVVHSALPCRPLAPGQFTQTPSNSLAWLRDLVKRSPVLTGRNLSGEEHRLATQLRSYLSLEGVANTAFPNNADVEGESDLLTDHRSVSRCAVYNLSNYTIKNLWGPYLPMPPSPLPSSLLHPQPKVNWEQVEHIMNVVVMNMRELENTPYSLARPKLGLEATRPYSAPGTVDIRTSGSKDWAGLEGLWRRFVCFMDYRELFAFNYSNLKSSLSASYFNDPNFTEAVRLLEMRIALTEVEDITEFDYPGCPKLHFEGYVRGLQSRNADVQGFIQRFLDGTIRWNFETIYDGVPQWSGECIQIGNICSAAGLAGIWSGVQHTAGDPAGPFVMWKIAESNWLDRDNRR